MAEVQVGSLSFLPGDILDRCDGKIKICRGMFGNCPVAVKHFPETHRAEALNEIATFIPELHSNVIQFYGSEYMEDNTYVCLEIWDDNLPAFIKNFPNQFPIAFHLTNFQLRLMRDIVSGLAHLHNSNRVYDRFNPNNVLIVQGRHAKLNPMDTVQVSDVDFNRRQQSDLFNLAYVLYYVMTHGVSRVIQLSQLNHLNYVNEAFHLLNTLRNANCHDANEILQYPVFWNSDMQLSFLREVSDELLADSKNPTVVINPQGGNSTMNVEIRNLQQVVIQGRGRNRMWSTAFGADLSDLTPVGKYYYYHDVTSLLRLIRNSISHYRDLNPPAQAALGDSLGELDAYFNTKFPLLFIEVYLIMKKFCDGKQRFKKYFRCSIIYTYDETGGHIANEG